MKSAIPRILLIGAGAFGTRHLLTLRALEKKGILSLAGIVVHSEETASILRNEYDVPIHVGLTQEILFGVDGVDIVTSPETHCDLVRQCLPFAHVLVEKPLTTSVEEAAVLKGEGRKNAHALMVGHIFRFHPVTAKIKTILASLHERPIFIEGEYINPVTLDKGRDIELEMMHLFDIVDHLFGQSIALKQSFFDQRLQTVHVKYRGGPYATYKLGWSGEQKKRSLKLVFKSRVIVCDFESATISIAQNGSIKQISCTAAQTPLEAELRAFIEVVRGKDICVPGVVEGARIVHMALFGRTDKKPDTRRKRVAVIGGGIFGANCAIELATSCDVTLFEKNDSLLSEASRINQYRHHWGYHYPRSQETMNDIAASVSEFEQRYGSAIIRKFPTYYSVAKEGSKVSQEQYLEFCDRNKLPYSVVRLEPRFINPEKISTCIKTFEPIYDYESLKKITEKELRARGVTLRMKERVLHGRIESDGSKTLITERRNAKVQKNESFDFVINATYARYNDFCTWFKFPVKSIRIDLVEVLWVKLNIPKMSFAVMDGPFTNMVPTGMKNVFTLVHIKESILRRFVPRNGRVPRDIFTHKPKSRIARIIKKSAEWLPISSEAEVVEVHHVLRGVNAFREHDDARPSDIAAHGFGCFSIFGGKIVHAVSTAKQLAAMVHKSQ